MSRDKQRILEEIRRTAAENDGTPLGWRKFRRVTGIRLGEWYGPLWACWSDALREAGFPPNTKKQPFSKEYLLEELAGCVRDLGRFPSNGQMLFRSRHRQQFPSLGPFKRLGCKRQWLAWLIEYCRARPDYADVLAICNQANNAANNQTNDVNQSNNSEQADNIPQESNATQANSEQVDNVAHNLSNNPPARRSNNSARKQPNSVSPQKKRGKKSTTSAHGHSEPASPTSTSRNRPKPDDANRQPTPGFVYLFKMQHHYKIGHSRDVQRRKRELAGQLPHRLTIVHVIATDDPPGIEAYWHKRFAAQRTHGEWFALTAAQVAAFQQRKVM